MMKAITMAALIVAFAFSLPVFEVEDSLGAALGKDVSCNRLSNSTFNCTIEYEDTIDIRCEEQGCSATTAFGSMKMSKNDGEMLKKSLGILPASAFCSLIGERMKQEGVDEPIEGCDCSKDNTGVSCKVERTNIIIECTEERCSVDTPAVKRSIPLQRGVLPIEKNREIVRDIPGGRIIVFEENGRKKLILEAENARGVKVNLTGYLKAKEGSEIRAALKGRFKELKEKIRKARNKDVDVLTALEVDEKDAVLENARIIFELPRKGRVADTASLSVFHIKDDGSVEEVEYNISSEGDVIRVEFSPKSFSIYALATVGQLRGQEPEEIPLKPETNTICIAGLLAPLAAGRLLKK